MGILNRFILSGAIGKGKRHNIVFATYALTIGWWYLKSGIVCFEWSRNTKNIGILINRYATLLHI